MFSRSEVSWQKAANFNIVCAIGKFIPIGRMVRKPIWIFLRGKCFELRNECILVFFTISFFAIQLTSSICFASDLQASAAII